MARDIEEFLRRAAERRRNAQQGGGQQRQPARPKPASPPPRQSISERDVVQPRQQAAPLPSKEPVKSSVHESVNDQVKHYLDVSDIATHVEELGDVIEQADERMEAHLDKTFDHDIGNRGSKKMQNLNDVAATNAKDSTELADNIFKLLQNPKTIRQSILIAEILKRPTFLDEE